MPEYTWFFCFIYVNLYSYRYFILTGLQHNRIACTQNGIIAINIGDRLYGFSNL